MANPADFPESRSLQSQKCAGTQSMGFYVASAMAQGYETAEDRLDRSVRLAGLGTHIFKVESLLKVVGTHFSSTLVGH